MNTNYRALVCPGQGDNHGLWYACLSYRTVTGGRGIRILGKGWTTWDMAADQAVSAAFLENKYARSDLRRGIAVDWSNG